MITLFRNPSLTRKCIVAPVIESTSRKRLEVSACAFGIDRAHGPKLHLMHRSGIADKVDLVIVLKWRWD